jgi:hypothetical protein
MPKDLGIALGWIVSDKRLIDANVKERGRGFSRPEMKSSPSRRLSFASWMGIEPTFPAIA